MPSQVEEKLTVRLNKDGGMEHMEVQGNMSLQVRTCNCLWRRHCRDATWCKEPG